MKEFQLKIKKIVFVKNLIESASPSNMEPEIKLSRLLEAVGRYSIILKKESAAKKQRMHMEEKKSNDFAYFSLFVKQVQLK